MSSVFLVYMQYHMASGQNSLVKAGSLRQLAFMSADESLNAKAAEFLTTYEAGLLQLEAAIM